MLRIALLTAAVLSCDSVSAQYIIAHRGASHDAPENTLPAFELAWRQRADGVEADFRLSSDGRVVCIHDKDTERVAGAKHVVAHTPYSVLRTLDVGSWKGAKYAGTHAPLAEEVFAAVRPGKLIYVELKTGPEIVAPIAEALDRSPLKPEQVVIISFDEHTIAACEATLPHVRTHWLSGYKAQGDELRPTAATVVETLARSNADGFGSKADRKHVNARFLQTLRAAGYDEFHLWTVDDPEVARFYQRLRPFSITTNRPGWLRDQLDLGNAAE